MSWKVDASAIRHLEHVWQPQADNWPDAIEFALTGLTDMMCLAVGITPACKVTRKIDDAVSLKIGMIGGKPAVGYKGANTPFATTEVDVDFMYFNHGAKQMIMHTLKYVSEVLSQLPNDSIHQIGVLGYDPDGLVSPVTPNVIPYELPGLFGQKLAMVHVASDKPCEPPKSTNNIYVLDNQVREIKDYSFDQMVSLDILMDQVEDAWKDMRGQFRFIEHHQFIQMFLNKHNRDGWSRSPTYLDYLEFLYSRATSGTTKFDTIDVITGQVLDNQLSYKRAFELVHALKQCTDAAVRLENPDVKEGYVISLPRYDGTYAMMKIVDDRFTRMNYAKWN